MTCIVCKLKDGVIALDTLAKVTLAIFTLPKSSVLPLRLLLSHALLLMRRHTCRAIVTIHNSFDTANTLNAALQASFSPYLYLSLLNVGRFRNFNRIYRDLKLILYISACEMG